MFVITANVRYYLDGPLDPSFLAFDTAQNKFIWDDESAEFFCNYQDACVFVNDYVNGRKRCACYDKVEDIKVKEIKIFDLISEKLVDKGSENRII